MSSALAVSPDVATIGRWRSRVTWPQRDVDPITTTSALFGQLRDDPRSRAEFLALTKETR